MIDPLTLPDDLPRPEDDGAADHLPGTELPDLALAATDGSEVALAGLAGRAVVYAYPWTGRPGEPLLSEAATLLETTAARARSATSAVERAIAGKS